MGRKYSDEELLQALRQNPNASMRIWNQMKIHPSASTILYRFGRWNSVRRNLGLPIYGKCGDISDEKLLNIIRLNKNIPINKWDASRTRPSISIIINRFGSWRRARELAGLLFCPSLNSNQAEQKRIENVNNALMNGDRWALRRCARTYLKLTDGWAEDMFERFTGKRYNSQSKYK